METQVETQTTHPQEQVRENEHEVCMAWVAGHALEGKDRAALVKANRWQPGDKISITFLDGDPDVQAKVRDVAKRWTQPGLARLTFDFRDNDPNALVRISFKYDGSWSTIGTSCKTVAKDQPTMNFGWLTPESDDDEIRRVVLHEFGHMLGLIHEHQNPAQGIQWNKEAVYAQLSGPPNNWSRQDIDFNMFQPYARAETNFTRTDPKSIMMYPIPKSWTTNGFSVGLNTNLSPTDIAFVHSQYR